VTGVATLAGASALSLSFATLFAGRIDTALRVCVMQALAAALAAGALGWLRHAPLFYFAALLAFVLNGLVLPFALRRIIGHAVLPPSAGMRCGFLGSSAMAFALVAASVAAVVPLTGGEDLEMLALGLAVIQLGLLLLAVRSHDLLPGLALLASQNGLVLTACAIPGLPPSILLLAAVPLVPSLVVTGAWLHDRNRLDPAPPWG
jgi:hydrogenase-4 membrane subunit HyfE